MRHESNREARPSIEERIGSTIADGVLTGAPLNHVIALGVVGIHERLAEAIFWLKYGNYAKSYNESLRSVFALSKRLNEAQRWKLRGRRLQDMAKAVLDYWLSDICPACEGRGYEKPPGAPYLSDKACQACTGHAMGRVGKRPFPWLLTKPRIAIHDKATRERKRDLRKRRQRMPNG